MAYITLDELKEILPDILDQWIDEDDESWEWIFSEIEQKCHIGTKRKGKKWKKYIEDDIYQLKAMEGAQSTAIAAHRNDIDKLTKRIDGLTNFITNLCDKYTTMATYDALEKKEIPVLKKECSTCRYGYGRDGYKPCLSCKHFNKWEAKETCETCKHSENVGGCTFGDVCKNYSDWEAKDNG